MLCHESTVSLYCTTVHHIRNFLHSKYEGYSFKNALGLKQEVAGFATVRGEIRAEIVNLSSSKFDQYVTKDYELLPTPRFLALVLTRRVSFGTKGTRHNP